MASNLIIYSNNGLSWRGEQLTYQAQPGEVAFDHFASAAELTAAFPGYAAAVAAASKPKPTQLDAPTLAAALIAKGVIAQGDINTAVSTGAGAGVISAVGTIASPGPLA